MERTKDLFLMMREQEIATNNFLPTKKEIETQSKKFAKDLIDSGEIDLYKATSQLIRTQNAIDIVFSEIKEHLPKDKHKAFGLEFTPVSGRTMIQFQEDELWQQLSDKLKQREVLLKTALNSNEPIYDNDGVQIPKVSVKYSKDSFQIKY
jgi:uncharacterized circularly permuted ATP-grasp superfamily protein